MRRALALLAVAVAACGGSEAAPSQTPSTTEKAAPEATTAGGGATNLAPEVAGARNDLDRAERDVAAAQADCAAACRALSSMERAAEHLCALDGGAECTRARERVEAARERVRAACGGCER